jgi:WD40 repeat protein
MIDIALEPSGALDAMLVSPDETLVVTATRYDSTVRVWDIQTFEVVAELSGHEYYEEPLAIHNLEMCSSG